MSRTRAGNLLTSANSTSEVSSVRRARNRRSEDFVLSNLDDRQGTGIRTVSHVLLLVRLGVPSQQDAGRAVGQQDGHGVVVDLGEQTAFCVRPRSYNVGLTAARASCPCIF